MTGVYREVAEPERLGHTSGAREDDEGRPQVDVLATVKVADQHGKSKLALRAVVIRSTAAATPALDGMEACWRPSPDCLAEYLATRAWGDARETPRGNSTFA